MGLFTGISNANSNYIPVMFSYYKTDGSKVYIPSLSEQCKILLSKINSLDGEITLVCHSQGCTIAAMTLHGQPKIENISKVILLAPAGIIDSKRIQPQIESLGNGKYFEMHRKNGQIFMLSNRYLNDLVSTDSIGYYAELARNYDVEIILAAQDEMVENFPVSKLPKGAKILKINGNHNFTRDFRADVIAAVSELLPV